MKDGTEFTRRPEVPTFGKVGTLEVGTPLGSRIAQIADKVGGNVALADLCGSSEATIRNWRNGKSEPGVSTMVAIARAGGVTVEWLATGAGPMRPGEAQQAPVAAPQSQAPQGVKECLSHPYQASYGAASGVKAAVSLAVAALGDQSQHIEPERLADLIDAAHQLLQEGADPALVRRLIAAAAGP